MGKFNTRANIPSHIECIVDKFNTRVNIHSHSGQIQYKGKYTFSYRMYIVGKFKPGKTEAFHDRAKIMIWRNKDWTKILCFTALNNDVHKLYLQVWC